MKIGILGSGIVAQTLGSGLLNLEHEVLLGTRDTSKLAAWLKKNNQAGARAGSFKDAAAYGEVIFLATFGLATDAAINLSGKENFEGKIVVDVTNPLDHSQGTPPALASSPGNSLGEQIQRQIPAARVVKAFNFIGTHIMVNARREEGIPTMFTAGNDIAAKKWVADLASLWGWSETIDMGGIEQAYWLEAFAMFWIIYGFKNNQWQHAFKLLKK